MEEIKATAQIDEDVKVGEFSKSEDWRVVKDRLFKKLLELDSLSLLYDGIKDKTIQNLGENALINGKVCSIIINWISEIESDGETLETNQLQLKEMKHDIIYRE